MSPTTTERAAAGDRVGLGGVDLLHVPLQTGQGVVAGAGASAVTLSAASRFSCSPSPVVAETPSTPNFFCRLVAKAVFSDRAITTPICL